MAEGPYSGGPACWATWTGADLLALPMQNTAPRMKQHTSRTMITIKTMMRRDVASSELSGAGVGKLVGAGLGTMLGAGMGSSVGELVGVGTGSHVGVGTGSRVGELVGAGTGSRVGELVGAGTGSSVGELVGAGTGTGVGELVGPVIATLDTPTEPSVVTPAAAAWLARSVAKAPELTAADTTVVTESVVAPTASDPVTVTWKSRLASEVVSRLRRYES